MHDLVGDSRKPKTLLHIQEHFRSRGYDVFGDAVFEGDAMVGALQCDVRLGYTFLAFQEAEFQQEVTRATDVAKEYGLPVRTAQRIFYVNGR